jgi:hypothetical protein
MIRNMVLGSATREAGLRSLLDAAREMPEVDCNCDSSSAHLFACKLAPLGLQPQAYFEQHKNLHEPTIPMLVHLYSEYVRQSITLR